MPTWTRFAIALALPVAACDPDRGAPNDSETVGPGEAALTLSPADADLGPTLIGTTSAVVKFVVHNDGAGTSGRPQARLTGPDAAAFALLADGCTAPLAPFGSCALAVVLRPGVRGPVGATLEVAHDDGTLTATLVGRGLAPAALSVDPEAITFDDTTVGTRGESVAMIVENRGDVATGAVRVTTTSPELALTSGCAEGLAPAARCTVTMAFAPRTPGDKAILVDVSASPGGRASALATGRALAPAHLGVGARALDFGRVTIGRPATALLTITNDGGSASGPPELSIIGTDAGRFARDGCDGALAPAAHCELALTFTPTKVDVATATLVVATPGEASDAPSTTVSLTGIGQVTQLASSPAARVFDDVLEGDAGAPERFVIDNQASTPSGPIVVSLRGRDAGSFAIATDACTGVSLAPGGSCDVDVAFHPTAAGDVSAELFVHSPDSGDTSAGLAGHALAQAALGVSPDRYDFGPIALHDASDAIALAIANRGEVPTGPLSLALAGSGFSLVRHTCPDVLAPGRGCVAFVRFTPDAAGLVSGSLTVAASPGAEIVVPLAGTGAIRDVLSAVPKSLAFDTTFVGDEAELAIDIDNASDFATGSFSLGVTGPNPDDFSFTHDCDRLAPRASCRLAVRFSPRAAGARAATLTFYSAADQRVSIPVAGIGADPIALGTSDGSALANPFAFRDVAAGTTLPPDVAIVVSNVTAAGFPIGVLPDLDAPLAIAADGCTGKVIEAGASCLVHVRFSPTSPGTFSGALTFTRGARGEPSLARLTWWVSGTAVDPLRLDAAAGTDFGLVPRNTRSAPLLVSASTPPGAPTTGPLAVVLTGTGFRLDQDDCSGQRLAAGSACGLAVSFAPSTNGPAIATLVVRGAPGGDAVLPLDGRGIDPRGVPPGAIALTPASVRENLPAGTVVGTLSATDPDPGDRFTWALVTGGADFALDGATLATRAPLDREAAAVHPIRVRVTDSGGQIVEAALDVTITDVDEPTIARDDDATIAEDAPATTIDVLANDRDPDTALTIADVTRPSSGVVAIAANARSLTYTPAPESCTAPGATIAFTYTLVSGGGATVRVAVPCEDDPAVALDDHASFAEGDAARAIPVLANDSDPDSLLRIASVTQPTEGVVAITGSGTGLTFTPATLPTKARVTFRYGLVGGGSATVTVDVSITTTGCDRPHAACAHGACADGGGLVATCACDAGWQGASCDSDIDECHLGLHDCDAQAFCRNTFGGWSCTCNPGWQGDGTSCSDVDECAAAIVPCAAGKVCVNRTGGFDCACGPGFVATTDGGCVDVDECASGLECTATGAGCVNAIGGFDCIYTGCYDTCAIPTSCDQHPDGVCPYPTICTDPDDPNGSCACATAGFEEGPGGGCFDVDECVRGLLTVPFGGVCVNDFGDAHAECGPGYELSSDATRCEDVDECATGALVCDAHATCINDRGGARCECVPGYQASGSSCVDVDECVEIAGACLPGSTCVNAVGGYSCVCTGGLVGDGQRCGIVADSAAACGDHATFEPGPPGHCLCDEGYAGDGATCSLAFPSTGIEGAFRPTPGYNATLRPGIHNFTTIDIPAGTTVYTWGSGVLDLRATGAVHIAGVIDLRGGSRGVTGQPIRILYDVSGLGEPGVDGHCSDGWAVPRGGDYGGGWPYSCGTCRPSIGGGGGGYAGGGGGTVFVGRIEESLGFGEGAGGALPTRGGAGPGPYAGGDGQEEEGFAFAGGGGAIGADAVADLAVFRTFRPGSGGGAAPYDCAEGYGEFGGGGGGALRIWSPVRIEVTGQLLVNGGPGLYRIVGNHETGKSGAGSGGVIMVGAPELVITGTLSAIGGRVTTTLGGNPKETGAGGLGRIRLSARYATCLLTGSFNPPLEDGCAASPEGGTLGYTYVGAWPN